MNDMLATPEDPRTDPWPQALREYEAATASLLAARESDRRAKGRVVAILTRPADRAEAGWR